MNDLSSVLYMFCVDYFDGTYKKRQWFNHLETAQKFAVVMVDMGFSNVTVYRLENCNG